MGRSRMAMNTKMKIGARAAMMIWGMYLAEEGLQALDPVA